MHLRLLTLIGLVLASGLQVQAQNADESDAPQRSREELRDLLGPVALYPDPLISLILPASTVPSDIVLANRFVKSGANPDEADEKSWDSSVKALVRYPDTLSWLDENLEWTTQVGDAFVQQPVDVMEAIQELRAKAREMGNLVDTPQQRIVQDDAAIRIVPAEPEYIYEPSYDPQVVYYQRPVSEPLVYFSAPLIVGRWLGYDFDWHGHRLYRGDWHHGWDYRRERDREREWDRDREYDRDRRGSNQIVVNRLANTQVWQVDKKRHFAQVRQQKPASRPSGERARPPVVVRPTPLANHIKHGEVRRGEPSKGGDRRSDGEMVRRGEPAGDNKGDRRFDGPGKPGDKNGKGKGGVSVPKTPAPFVNGDGRRGNDDHKGMIDRNGDGRPDGIKPKSNDDRKGMVDRNGDGRPDVIKPKSNDDHKSMIDRNGDGRPDVTKPKGSDSTPRTALDRNGDGRPDITKPKGNDTTPRSPMDRNRDGRPDITKPKGNDSTPRTATDRNGDGRPDSVVKPKSNDSPRNSNDRNGDGRPDSMVKPKNDAPRPHVEVQKPKNDSPRPRVDAPKPKMDAPRPHVDAPKPKSNPAPQKPRVEAPKPRSAPPAVKAAPKPAPKPQAAPSKSRSGGGDGKKKDKDKKD